MPSVKTRLLTVAALTTAALAALVGCAPADESAPATTAMEAVSFENCGQEVTFTEVPSRVVILNGVSVAEVNSFIALGIEDSVIANLQSYGVSDDPALVEQIAALPDGGLTVNENFGPPAEQLLSLAPDLVVSTYAGGFDASLGFATRDELQAAGANTLVTPTNCANGNSDASEEEQEVFTNAGIDASYGLLRTLGEIFQVEDRAEVVISGMQDQLDSVAAAVEGRDSVTGVVLSPGFGSDVPTAWTGGIFDDVLLHAGVENVFPRMSQNQAGSFSAEQMLLAAPDVVVLFANDSVDVDALRASIEEQYPDWPAVQTDSFVTVYDGVYLGPTNAIAVEKIARVAHPGAF